LRSRITASQYEFGGCEALFVGGAPIVVEVELSFDCLVYVVAVILLGEGGEGGRCVRGVSSVFLSLRPGPAADL